MGKINLILNKVWNKIAPNHIVNLQMQLKFQKASEIEYLPREYYGS